MTRVLSMLLTLGLISTGLCAAHEDPTALLPGPGGNPADIEREVLWLDNPDFSANAGSSEIIAAFDMVSEIANDFLLEVDASVQRCRR